MDPRVANTMNFHLFTCRSRQSLYGTTVFVLIISLIMMVQVSVAYAAGLTKTFQAKTAIANGTVVSLEDGAAVVVPASRDNMANLYGVVVPSGDLAFTQTQDDTSSVLVAKDGVVETLVSTVKGDIKSGDAITVSAVKGIGEKAVVSGKIIGIAQANFTEQSAGSEQFSIETNKGSRNVKVGIIPVKIEVQMYSISSGAQGLNGENANRNKVLQIADSIAGETVKPFALLIAGLVLLFGVFISAFLVTSSGYASLVSIGRNPLAEKKIVVSLMKMLLTAAAIFLLSVLLAYVILVIV